MQKHNQINVPLLRPFAFDSGSNPWVKPSRGNLNSQPFEEVNHEVLNGSYEGKQSLKNYAPGAAWCPTETLIC